VCSQGIFKKRTFFKGKKLKSYNEKGATDVADMMQMLFEFSGSDRELMALMVVIKLTKTDTSIQTWIDGQLTMECRESLLSDHIDINTFSSVQLAADADAGNVEFDHGRYVVLLPADGTHIDGGQPARREFPDLMVVHGFRLVFREGRHSKKAVPVARTALFSVPNYHWIRSLTPSLRIFSRRNLQHNLFHVNNRIKLCWVNG
jgi:hypothetical protein